MGMQDDLENIRKGCICFKVGAVFLVLWIITEVILYFISE